MRKSGLPAPDSQRELIEAIREWAPALDPVDAETPLFQSGYFDSLALFNLVTWIEDRIGAPVEVDALDPTREWTTVAEILRYVERARISRR